METKIGTSIYRAGCITQDKYLKGKSMRQIEKILGFQQGRFAEGMYVAILTELPSDGEFELAGYSQVASHRRDAKSAQSGLDVNKLKKNVLSSWQLSGPDRLVKIIPNIKHDNALDPNTQYPPGLGVPQWNLTKEKRFQIIALCKEYPNGVYQ